MTKISRILFNYVILVLFIIFSTNIKANAVNISYSNHIAFSQSDSSNIEIDEVIVVANMRPRNIALNKELKGKELQSLSAYSVADALRHFSGMQVKDFGGIGGLKTVNVRSMGSQHVGVFYDGIKIDNAQNGVVDLGRYSLDNMESITVYLGEKDNNMQAARDYASSSSVYLETRKPKFSDNQNKKYNLKLGLNLASFKTINPKIYWEQSLRKNISMSVSSEYLYTSGEYPFTYKRKNAYDTTEYRKNGDVNLFRYEMAFFGDHKGGDWRAKAYYYRSERGYPGASVRNVPGKYINQDRQWDQNFFLQGKIRSKITDRYSILLNAKYAYDYLHYVSDPRMESNTIYVDNTYRQQEMYLSLANSISLFPKVWYISLSNDISYNTLDADLTDFVYPIRSSIYTALASNLTYKGFRMQASLLSTYMIDDSKFNGKLNDDRHSFSPSVMLAYKPFDNIDIDIKGFYKESFRLPTLNDLYYTVIGNKYLKPEIGRQWDLAIDYNVNLDNPFIKKLRLRLDGYINTITDKIIATPTSNQFRWTMLNLGKVDIKGFEAEMQGTFAIGSLYIYPHLTYTYQRAKDITDPSSEWYGGQIPYIPRHSLSILASAVWNTWRLNYSFIFTGKRYDSVANIDYNYIPQWITNDISISKDFVLFNNKYNITGEINNIFNQQYEVVRSYPMPGVNWKLKLSMEL